MDWGSEVSWVSRGLRADQLVEIIVAFDRGCFALEMFRYIKIDGPLEMDPWRYLKCYQIC